jgi:hypothetical protein
MTPAPAGKNQGQNIDPDGGFRGGRLARRRVFLPCLIREEKNIILLAFCKTPFFLGAVLYDRMNPPNDSRANSFRRFAFKIEDWMPDSRLGGIPARQPEVRVISLSNAEFASLVPPPNAHSVFIREKFRSISVLTPSFLDRPCRKTFSRSASFVHPPHQPH